MKNDVLRVQDITMRYLRDNYNPEKYRKDKEVFQQITFLDFDECDDVKNKHQNIDEFLSWIKQEFVDNNCTHIKIDYNYDSTVFEMYKKALEQETDQEVFNRLQKSIRVGIRKSEKYEKGRKEYNRLKEIYGDE